MPERQFGPYRLVRQIAVGGMAEIHLAKTKGLAGFEKYVALKMIHPNFAEDDQFIQMLVDEAKIAVQLTHGNIAQTFDLGRVGDTYYITMEYIDGADLYKLLRRGSEIDLEMPLDVCAYVGKDVASALDYAHRKKDTFGKSLGIVHRDISPQNVLVSYAGEVKLVDFGIAKATSKAKQTAIGVIKGKYYYMSPEQAWGDPIDHRSDIFSAGIVLYEMLTGQMLYLEEDLHRLLDMARRADIAPPSSLRKGIPPQLERIVMHALAKVPGERYQSAGDFATDLERFLHAYSPVFTAAKLSTLLRQVVGEATPIPDDEEYDVEVRSGPLKTHPLPAEAVLRADEKAEIRDDNSVLFRLGELKGRDAKPAAVAAAEAVAPAAVKAPAPARASSSGGGVPSIKPANPTGGKPVVRPGKPPTGGSPVVRPVPKLTRPADPAPDVAIPSIPGNTAKEATSGPLKRPAAPTPFRAAPVVKARGLDDNTREMAAVAPPPEEHSGLLTLEQPKPEPPIDLFAAPPGGKGASAAQRRAWADAAETQSIDEELENVGERTVITKPADADAEPTGGGAGVDLGTDPGIDHADEDDSTDGSALYRGRVDATMITAAPSRDTSVQDVPSEDVGDIDAAIDAALAADAAASRDGGPSKRGKPTPRPSNDDVDDDEPTFAPEDNSPTVQRDLRAARSGRPPAKATAKPSVKKVDSAAAPPALSANIHSPAVSEIRKPRPSRKTPPGGAPVSGPGNSVLQAIVGAQTSEPMPTPRPVPAVAPPPPTPPPFPAAPAYPPPMAGMNELGPPPQAPPGYYPSPPAMAPYPNPADPAQMAQMSQMMPNQSGPQLAYGTPMAQQGYPMTVDPARLGLNVLTPPPGMPVQSYPGVPPHLQPYAQYGSQPMPASPYGSPYPQGYAPGYAPPYPQQGFPNPNQTPGPPGFPALGPTGYPQQQGPMGPSLTGQLRLSEVDEVPVAYQLSNGRSWVRLAVVGLLVVGVAMTATIVIIKQRQDSGPTVGTFRFESTPVGADIIYDGTRLTDKTPFPLDGVPVGSRHEVRIELAHYVSEDRTVDLPHTGGEIEVTFALKPVVGKIVVNCPAGTEVRVDNVLRLTGPGQITDVDLSAKHIELRAAGYQPYVRDLSWPANGVITIEAHLQK